MADQWRFPKPSGLRFSRVTETGYQLEWSAVRGPHGQEPSGYTVRTLQLDGVVVDEFTTREPRASEYGRGGRGLHPGYTYESQVWANGAPMAPEHATIKVTLRPHIVPERPGPVGGGGQAPAPTPIGPATTPAGTTTPGQRSNPPQPPPHPAVWQPWTVVLTRADNRMRTEIAEALKVYDQALERAGRILDVAYSEASQVAGQLEAAAWDAWSKTMAQAAEASNRILGPAVTRYDQAIGDAHTMFATALGSAEAAYKQTVADANRAKNDAPSAPAAA